MKLFIYKISVNETFLITLTFWEKILDSSSSLLICIVGSQVILDILLSSGDIELDQLRRRLRETEAAMERIVEQMAKVPLKMQVCEGPLPIHCTYGSFASHRFLFSLCMPAYPLYFFPTFRHHLCRSSRLDN